LQAARDFLWPRGGWGRAFEYVKHRLRRLPDTPQRIARGIWAGIFICFTPIFGLHFIGAAVIAKIMRGNIVASLMATFFGNPLTFPPIAVMSLELGYWIQGERPNVRTDKGIMRKFSDAGGDIWHNIKAVFTADKMDWRGLHIFFDDVFWPYFIGGLIPGIVAATAAYYVSLPLITAYQNRRRKRLREKMNQLRPPG